MYREIRFYNHSSLQAGFPTEQALYYSYFKDAVRPDMSLPDAVRRYIHDDTVEYPNVINALQVL